MAASLKEGSFPVAPSSISVLSGVVSVFIALSVHGLGLAIYRLYFSPLAHFPGPKLAAVSLWYQAYYDVWMGGRTTFHLQTLHKKYGPIIRIAPYEVHISDPEFYETIYSTSKPFSKYNPHQAFFDAKTASATTIDHAVHKNRRAALNPFFSPQAISRFSNEIQIRATSLCNRLNSEYAGRNKPLDIAKALGCFAADVIIEYCFAKDYDYLSVKDFEAPFVHAMHDGTELFHVAIQFPWIMPAMKMLPERFVGWLNPVIGAVFKFRDDMRLQAADLIYGNNESHKDAAHPTVFREILDSDLPPEEKSLKRLAHEAVTMVGAGIETIKWTISVAIVNVLSNPSLYADLKAEIVSIWPDIDRPPSLQALQKSPLLNAVGQEALRLSYGVSFRLARTSTTPIQYKSYTIPPGVAFSMGTYSMHHNETVFPSSYTFDPSRWLPTESGSPPTGPDGKKPLTRYLASFSRGTRQCIGMNLAYAEFYICLASLVRLVDMELFETGLADVKAESDRFIPWPRKESKGVRVLIK